MLVNNNLPLQKKVDNFPTENSDNLVSSGGVFNAIDSRGIPSGGMNGQVLGKASDADYDTTWLTPTGGTTPPAPTEQQLVSAPKGSIMAWYGEADTVPEGWAVCDGENGTPDLRGRFLLGANESHLLGEEDGEESHQLTIEELAKHRHTFYEVRGTVSSGGVSGIWNRQDSKGGNGGNAYTDEIGNNMPHNNMPPYTVINWIMKMVDDPDPITVYSVKAPVGTIVIWSGSKDQIPEGWALCDGQNGSPDLRDKFVLGAGENHPVGEEGGEETHTLTVEELAKHLHTDNAYGGNVVKVAKTSSGTENLWSTVKTTTGETGNNTPHNNMPPYYALCYIIKLTPDETDGVDLTNYVTNEKLDEKLENLNIDTSNLTTKTDFNTYKTEVNGLLGDIGTALSEILNGGNEGLLDMDATPIPSSEVATFGVINHFRGGELDASV